MSKILPHTNKKVNYKQKKTNKVNEGKIVDHDIKINIQREISFNCVKSLGRGGCNRSRENPGIAKKGGGV